MSSVFRAWTCAVAALGCAACAGAQPVRSSHATSPAAAALAVPPCTASPVDTARGGAPEVRGQVSGRNQLWALLLGSVPLPRGQDVKIVWRMTGGGELRLTAYGPHGAVRTPDWGPVAHGGSTWARPGSEWGAGFTFTRSGCWVVVARRGGLAGEVGLEVA